MDFHPVVFIIATTLAILFVFQSDGAASLVATASVVGVTAGNLSSYFPSWSQQKALGVAVWQFVVAFILILFGLILKKVSDSAFRTKLTPFLERTSFGFGTLVATAASKPFGYLFFLGGIAGALAVLPLPEQPNVRGFVSGMLKAVVVANIAWFVFRSVDAVFKYLGQAAGHTQSKLDEQLIPLIRKALKVTIGLICCIWVLQLLGYSVSSLIAGLGIGGLAVALALQDTLANFFGSIFILLDRPFKVGDWIRLQDVEGIVEDIGFRSTRIRTWPTTLVSIPNKTVASVTIDNWSRMPKRRVMQTVGVTYGTGPEKMERVVDVIRSIVENDEGVDTEYIVIRFNDFGDYSLNILLYYFTKATAFADHLATKERINLAIMRTLRDLGVSIAFPTRTVYLEGQAGSAIGSGVDSAFDSSGTPSASER